MQGGTLSGTLGLKKKMPKFTDRFIKNLKPEDKTYDVREGDGFCLRVYPSGKKSFFFAYRFQNKRNRLTIGSYPAMSLKDARLEHRKAATLRDQGKNPAEEKQQEQRRVAEEPTVNDLIKEYMDRWSKPTKKSWRADQRIFDVDVAPVIGKRKVSDIKRRDLVLLLEKIVDRGSPNQSWQTLKVLRRMFNFAVERDILENSPCNHIKPVARIQSKTRWLSESEILWFWHALEDTKISFSVKNCLRMILLTGQRPGEVLQIHWSEIDGKWWTIPPERSKNKRENRVYLSTLTRRLLIYDYNGLPFPSSRSDDPMHTNVLSKAVRRMLEAHNSAQAAAGLPTIEPFTPHDLRRTAATHMAHMGISEFVIGKVLNHTNESITGVYNRYAYDKEKRHALIMWARHLQKVLR